MWLGCILALPMGKVLPPSCSSKEKKLKFAAMVFFLVDKSV